MPKEPIPATYQGLPVVTAERMRQIDRVSTEQRGLKVIDLMENAGRAVAAETVAFLAAAGKRLAGSRVSVVCGRGANGGDGLVAARRLARAGAEVVVVLVAGTARPSTLDAARNWDRLEGEELVTRVHAPVVRDLATLGQNVERASVVVDALLGTGVRGVLRDPIRAAVELVRRARAAGVPVVAVDTPTAVDLSSGDPSDPVVTADLTVTFHRPKTGLRTKRGASFAGRVLVAPIGIPLEADRG